MRGLTEHTEKIFEPISKLESIKGYTLIGGTALSLQIANRLSEDLDFCTWSANLKKDKPTVAWSQIQKELQEVGDIEKIDVLGFDQVNFFVNGVKISFIAKQKNLSPVKKEVPILNNLKAADLEALGIMKVELILRRTLWRDYYDIYSIMKEGVSLKAIVDGSSRYSNHLLKTRDALNFLSNGSYYKKDKDFDLLKPVYDIGPKEIEAFIKSSMKDEYPLNIPSSEHNKEKNKDKGLSG